jgi:molybdenum cofactor biosynthesis enzyme MoaA
MSMTEKDDYRLLSMLKDAGIRRINFAGGEPTVVQELPNVVSMAHKLGIEATLVTNSTGTTNGMISAIKVSVDSNF